ncbi:hypothetical protein RchiOBHm_Chr7g0220811 [Rosa chinensis]|uniref:Uncharacterized protein n=1 Tax=Rosa chinensis TaxID=74649 RepID=A0A2P6PCW0_ROSCH|nr:hypothetical protein RchiOBHm_Chr7g0220811 [Rosa chinensis]
MPKWILPLVVALPYLAISVRLPKGCRRDLTFLILKMGQPLMWR